MKKLKILLVILAFSLVGNVFIVTSCQKTKADGAPEAPPTPTIYVGESKSMGIEFGRVVVVTVDGKRFICYSNGGICPIN